MSVNKKEEIMTIKLKIVLMIMLVFIVIPMLYFTPRDMTIYGHSMVPTIADGYKVNVIPYQTYKLLGKSLSRMDVVVVQPPKTIYSSSTPFQDYQEIATADERYSIKRIVGLPGDHVQIQNNSLKLNDVVIDHNEVGDGYDIDIVCDGYFLLGDYPVMSTDSRTYGCLPEDKIAFVLTEQDKYGLKLGGMESIIPQPGQLTYEERKQKQIENNELNTISQQEE